MKSGSLGIKQIFSVSEAGTCFSSRGGHPQPCDWRRTRFRRVLRKLLPIDLGAMTQVSPNTSDLKPSE